jgi:hypothetical protein
MVAMLLALAAPVATADDCDLRLRGDRPDRAVCAGNGDRERFTIPQFVNEANFIGDGDNMLVGDDGFAEDVFILPWWLWGWDDSQLWGWSDPGDNPCISGDPDFFELAC